MYSYLTAWVSSVLMPLLFSLSSVSGFPFTLPRGCSCCSTSSPEDRPHSSASASMVRSSVWPSISIEETELDETSHKPHWELCKSTQTSHLCKVYANKHKEGRTHIHSQWEKKFKNAVMRESDILSLPSVWMLEDGNTYSWFQSSSGRVPPLPVRIYRHRLHLSMQETQATCKHIFGVDRWDRWAEWMWTHLQVTLVPFSCSLHYLFNSLKWENRTHVCNWFISLGSTQWGNIKKKNICLCWTLIKSLKILSCHF